MLLVVAKWRAGTMAEVLYTCQASHPRLEPSRELSVHNHFTVSKGSVRLAPTINACKHISL